MNFPLLIGSLLLAVNANRVSLCSDNRCLRYSDSHITLPVLDNSETMIYETAWDIDIQQDGSFSLTPLLQPNISIKAIDGRGITLGSGYKETSWILLPAGNSSFKIKSKFYAGYSIGYNAENLGITRDDDKAISFYLVETNIPAPLLLLATDMNECSAISIPAFSSDSFTFVQEQTMKKGLFYRIISQTHTDQCIASVGDRVALASTASVSIQNSTWIVRSSALIGVEATLLFELAFYPGVYINTPGSSLRMSVLQLRNIDSASFSVQLDALNMPLFSISPDLTPVKASITDLAGQMYLKHRNGMIITEPLSNLTAINRYDATWLLARQNATSSITLTSITLPALALNETRWRIMPGTSAYRVFFLSDTGLFLGVGSDNTVLLVESRTTWRLQTALSFPSSELSIVPKLDYLIGKTVKFTEVLESEIMLISHDSSQELIKPKLYRFIVSRSLSGTERYCSFQSLLYPGYWLRQVNLSLHLHQFEDTSEFKSAATWKMAFGFLNDVARLTVSIESLAYPGMFVDIEGLAVKEAKVPEAARINFYLEEIRPEMIRRKRRTLDEL